MKYHILAFGAGFLLDQLFGDPYFLPHPIRGIGWLIAKTEKTLRAGNPQGNPTEREGWSADRENFWWWSFYCLRECCRH